jgi:hypothetical protein
MGAMRRVVKFVAIFGALGMLASALVAWSLAWAVKTEETEGRLVITDVLNRRYGDHSCWCTGRASDVAADYLLISQYNSPTLAEWPALPVPHWVGDPHWGHDRHDTSVHASTSVWSIQGWPWRALRQVRYDCHPTSLVLGGFTPFGDGWSSLPFEPYWPGLLANTAFYGVILWALWFTPGALRRGLRRRRGACVRCGYDLRGVNGTIACPECGM